MALYAFSQSRYHATRGADVITVWKKKTKQNKTKQKKLDYFTMVLQSVCHNLIGDIP